LPQRFESPTEFLSEKLRLLPRREMAALVDLVEIDQVAIGALGPAFGARYISPGNT
jgi:hypothetical protein